MRNWQKFLSHFWEINIKKYHSELNGELFVNLEFGKKVLHTSEANYSYQKLHKVLSNAIESVIEKLPESGHVLNLGLGGGSSVVILREELGWMGDITSIEHDEVIVEIAKTEFNIDRFKNHEIVISDALEYVNLHQEKKYDLIICDLFKHKTVPEKFKTESFFKQLVSMLLPNGYLILNYVKQENEEAFFEAFIQKLNDGFEYYVLNPVKGNYVLVLGVGW
jgi:spermidine synthase